MVEETTAWEQEGEQAVEMVVPFAAGTEMKGYNSQQKEPDEIRYVSACQDSE
jgi:hypothetical protein